MFYSMGDYRLEKCEYVDGVISLTVVDDDDGTRRVLKLKPGDRQARPMGWRKRA
jgi:hypothetical protein